MGVLRKITFRHVAGAGCLAAAILFLVIDSNILARGAARYAVSEWDKVSFGAVAATVPWIIAIMPFLFAITWKPGKYIGRPSTWTLAIAVVWITFVAYNIFGAGGSISFTRTDVLSARKFEASRERDTAKRRENLQAQLDQIPPSTRAPAAVEGLMAAERAKITWKHSEQCRGPSTGRERVFCAAYAKLSSELGQAKMRDKLSADLLAIDDSRAVAGWVAEVVDPMAQFWSGVTGWSELSVQRWAPIATPVVLQLGSWIFLSFALILFGFTGHRNTLFGRETAHAYAVQSGGGAPARTLTATSPRRFINATQFVAEWFAEHARPVSHGAVAEENWYALYSKECALSGIVPVEVETFRAVAEKHGAKVTSIDGKFYYQRVLPLVA
ncbi:MAG: hypothetical protein K2X43_01165 [Hyphomonadaceae bacterium]|jgi:hypothetical protein|nr:hypothetical protein [Hyphomonadaceae bacterium]